MPIELCVLIWAVPGREADLIAYEDAVLALIPAHGGRVVSRVRRIDGEPGPLEVHLIQLPDDTALEAYLADPVRVAMADTRQAVVERTELIRVRTVD